MALANHENIDAIWASLDSRGFSSDNATAPTAVPKHVLQEKPAVQSKGRRSWFENPPTKTLEIAQEPTREKPTQRRARSSDEEDMDILTLTHFTNPPRIDFGKIKPGVTRRRQLLVSNPHDYDQKVVVERVPSKKKFSADLTEFVVEAEHSVVLTITWRPEDEGPHREMFLFLIDGVYRLQAIVFGQVIAPPQKRKDKKGLLASRVKKPFSVLHTQNFSNIKQSYTPRRSNTSKKNVVLTGYNKQTSRSNLDGENVAPNRDVTADMTRQGYSPLVTNADQLKSSTPVEKDSEGMAKQQTKHRNSVRRSTTFTKIGLTEDTPDRTTVLTDMSPNVTHISPAASDTEFASLPLGTTIEPCGKLSTSVVSKLDFDSAEDSCVSENISVKETTYNTTPAKMSEQPISRACISPNTFVRENFRAISTPDQVKFLEQEMMTHVFKSSEQSVEVFRGSTITQSDKAGSEIQIGETITMHTMTQTFTQNTITMATPPANRSHAFTSQVHVSPMSFFRDSMSNTPDTLSVTSVSNKVPSPGMVLNNSVPHEIMVRQLGFVRKSLTGGELPPSDWQSSPGTACTGFPVFTKGKSDGKERRTALAVAKTKTRRRSGSKLNHQKKLFSDIADCQSPRRTTFLVNNKVKSGKTASSVQRFQKAGSKVIGKVMSAVNKTKPKRKSLDAKPRTENPTVVFSTHADSPNIVTKPLESRDESNPSRLTIVVRKPKVLKSAKQKKDKCLVSVPPSKCKSIPLSPVLKKAVSPVVDSATVTKAKPDVLDKCSERKVDRTESSAIQLFPVSPAKAAQIVPTLVDSTTVTKDKPDVLDKSSDRRVETTASSAIQLFPVSPDTAPKVFSPVASSATVTKTKPDVLDKGGERNVEWTESSARPLLAVSPVKAAKVVPPDGFTEMDIGSPQPLPTSPHPETTRRGTMTVTKHKPSEVLLKSSLSGKSLFGKMTYSPRMPQSAYSSTPVQQDAHPSGSYMYQCLSDKKASGGNNSTFDQSAGTDALSQISLEYVCSSDSGSSANGSPELSALGGGDSAKPVLGAVKLAELSKALSSLEESSVPEVRKVSTEAHGTVSENPSGFTDVEAAHQNEEKTTENSLVSKVKKVSPAVDREERFISQSVESIKYTPSRCDSGIEKQRILRRQLATTEVDRKDGDCSNTSNALTSQKKRYHSDSSAVLNRTNPERLGKRPKVSDSSASGMPKTRMRHATDSSIKFGNRRDRPKFSGQPGLPQSRLVLVKHGQTALPKHPMPFAAKNMYYDERWIEKQERGFVKWLNFILTPPEEYHSTAEKVKVDAGSVSLDPKGPPTRLAPTKEVLSLRAYAARRRMNRLRRAACRLYQGADVVRVIQKLEAEVESYRIAVRRDRMVHADVGLKQKILDLILSYNSLWLRIGLETIYGEILPLQSNSDVIGLSRFILTRLLGNPDISMEFSHPTVPHLYRDGYQEAISKHVLKKFLMLVFFLDVSKRARLIDHDPCLFCKDAEWKSSKELLFQFAKDYLSGEGDITRHLGYLGYAVSHVQLPLDEFDYAVTNLAKDLRDGLRLTRVIELLTHTWDLCKRLRVPAISRLQKVHNLEMTFKALTQHSHISDPTDSGKVSPRDIVDGHREKTLALLWNIIFNFQVDLLINEAKLQEEVQMLTKCLRVRKDWSNVMGRLAEQVESPWEKDRGTDSQICQKSEKLRLLLEWTRAVCAFYSLKIENFTVSFSDGRAFCYLVHHYYPGLLPLSDIQAETSMMYQDKSQDLDDSFSSPMIQQIGSDSAHLGVYEKLLSNERDNFKLLFDKVSELGGIPLMVKSTDMSNTIPDERVVVTYLAHLCARLLDIQEEVKAARVIQTAWRRRRIQRQRVVNQVQAKAASLIQRKVRAYLVKRRRQRREIAALRIQTAWRGCQARRVLSQLKWEKKNQDKLKAVQVLQRAVRTFLRRLRMSRKRLLVLCLQAHVRGYLARKALQRDRAARKIQAFFRSAHQMSEVRQEFIQKRNAAICLQSAFRRKQERKLRARSALAIQTMWKCSVQRRSFLKLRSATICIQTRVRMVSARRRFMLLHYYAVAVQRRYRARIAMEIQRKKFTAMRMSAILIQASWRGLSQRLKYQRLRQSAVVIQTGFRGYKARIKFLALRLATVIVQRQFRAQLEMRRCKREYLALKVQREQAAIVIQRHERGRQMRSQYLKVSRAAVTIQSASRGILARREFKMLKGATVVIQRCFRKYKERCLEHESVREKSAIVIQAWWRMHRARINYFHIRRAAIIIQSSIRTLLCRREFIQMRSAAVIIQQHYRAFRLGTVVRLEIDIMVGAATTIQSSWKRYQARKWYFQVKSAALTIQGMWQAKMQRKKFRKMRTAAVTLQRQHRNSCLARRVRSEFCELKSAALTVQRAWRRKQCLVRQVIRMQALRRGKVHRRRYLRLRKSAAVIQKHFRAHRFAKQAKNLRCVQVNSAVVIQACWKGYAVRREYVAQRKAVVILQAHLRGYFHRRRFLQVRAAALVLQSRYRAFSIGRNEREKYFETIRAVVQIQTVYRGCKCRRTFLNQLAAVRIIQTNIKAFLVHRRSERAAVVLQRAYRARLVMKKDRENYLQLKKAAVCLQMAFRLFKAKKSARELASLIKLQSRVRGYLQRKRFLQKRTACIILQANWRRCQCLWRFHQVQKAAVCLQRFFRANKAGQFQRNLYITQRTHIIRLQAATRGFLIRRSLQQQHEAAILIQTCFRRFSLCKDYIRQKNAAVVVQRWFRGYREMTEARKQFCDIKSSCVEIQAFYRGCKQRREFSRWRKSCIIIQSRLRGMLQRQRYLKLQQTVLGLQERVRANQLMRKERRAFCDLKSAAVLIQAFARGYLCRKETRHILAARCIQAWWRGSKERQRFLTLRDSTIRIQACFRGYLARLHYERVWWASMVIKRWWLVKRLVRERERELRLQRQHMQILEATVKIQKWYRLLRRGKMQREQFLQIRSAIVDIQKVARAFLIRRTLRRNKAAVVLQSYFRMQQEKRLYLQKRRATITLQSWTRVLISKRKRERRQFAVVILQRNIRAYLFCLTIHKAARLRDCSACKIQIWYRKVLTERHHRQVRAATKLQAVYRGFLRRRDFLQLRRAVVVVQTHFRRLQALKAYQYLVAAYEEHRQARVAEFILRSRRELSALRIQRCFRRHRRLQVARKHLASVIYLQRWMRGRLDRLRYLRMLSAATTIQGAVRRWRLRRDVAARRIQCAVRAWLEKRLQEKREEAATMLQARWRGYSTRRRSSKELKQMRQRVQEANDAATDDKKLGQRTASALEYLLRCKQLAYILEALMHLEVVTRLSAECCLRITEVNAVDVIFRLIRSCNRSMPHMELIKYSLDILLNLAKFDRTVRAVHEAEDSVLALVDLMQIYREKGVIFSKACTLLGILGLDPARRKEILNDTKTVERIRSIHSLTARKQKIEDTRLVTKSKLIAARTSFNSTLPLSTPSKRAPKVRPDWFLRRDSLKVIENPLSAINFVLDSLHVTPKGGK